ncbi:MAG: AAA family ATPase, partial [Oscillospiraceae bacterium]|nr:AAA family ATPase [Oscillospiraceae bacterium]
MENLEELRGSVESITFRNEENSFTVLELSSGEALVTVKGVLPQISPGEELRLLGRTEHNPTWGRQFAAQFCERRLPGTQGELLKYLSSGVIKGVGPAMARRIVEALGDDAFSALENNPAKLAEIKGISPKKAEEICEGFKKQFSLRQVMIALERLGMTTAECLRVHKAFGTRAPELIKKNPYVLCEAELGIRFERADHIARAMPEPPDAAFRTQAGVLHVLRRASYDGHSCYPEEQTIAPCVRLLQCGDGQVREAIQILLEQRRLLRHHFPEGAFLFLPYLFNAEQGIAQKMEFLLRYPPAATKLSGDLSEVITRMEDKHAIHYAPEQREAMRIALERGLLILTGGPGTGKTTTLRGILELLRRGGLKVSLAAPTGRAAKRMQDLTDENAKTIHRLLEVEWTPDDRQTFARNRRNPLDTHAVIIDEISMVDVPLFSALLDALPLGCRLVLVGDADQLPPVGAGSVLQDLLRARQLPVVRLETIFRQAMESLIVTNSHRIVRGEMPELGCKDRDFFFLERGSV